MPTIRVELFEGRTIEQKRALAQAFENSLGAERDVLHLLRAGQAGGHDLTAGGDRGG